MAYIRFLGEKTPHKATVIPTNNIVTVKFGTDVIENKNGFDLFLDKECTIDIGGTFYQKFTTIYRNDSVTKKYNGYQLSNDGSVYVEPEISPNPKPYNPTLDEVKESKKAEIKMKVQNEILSDVMIASYAFGYNESDMIAIRNAYEDSISSGMSVILKDSTGQSRELNEEEITDLYKKQEIKRLEKESYALLFVVLWLVLAGLVSLVLPESLADMDSTLLPVFCSLTASLTPLGLLARTVLSLLQMTYSRLELFLLELFLLELFCLELSLLVSLNYSRADWLVRPAHLLLEWNALE